MKKALGFLLLAGLLSVTDANAQIEKEIINCLILKKVYTL